MNTWSNIQISPQDPEIVQINNLQNSLGKLPQDYFANYLFALSPGLGANK